jgi:hypothetical protein
MRFQSAGRLGNILFIWSYAFSLSRNQGARKITIFADKSHTKIDKDLIETFKALGTGPIKFEINNYLGLILRIVDKISVSSPKFAKKIRQLLRISSEGQDKLEGAWIIRGFFQSQVFTSTHTNEIYKALIGIVQSKAQEDNLFERFPFLMTPYQALHIRLTDYIGSDFGVVDPESQLVCLQENLKVVICTDGTREEIASRINVSNFEVITPENSSAWETLAILSGAENLVTTNSTLSWWSGFLASQSGRTVWVPLHWNPELSQGKRLPSGTENTYIPTFE